MARVRLRDELARVRARMTTQAAAPAGPGATVRRVLADLREHAARYRHALGATDLTPFELGVFSQNGEDGVIAEILTRTGTGSRSFVEFGVGTGHQGNCVLLADVYAWSGLFIEADSDDYTKLAQKYERNPRVRTACALVTPDNVEATFQTNGVPEDLDVLSIDIDGMDYWVWRAIQAFRPRLVVIEFNASLPADEVLVWPPDHTEPWDGTSFYGSSLGALVRLGLRKGYTLVHTDLCGINAFFVRDDLATSVGVVDPPKRFLNIGFTGSTMPADPLNRRWLTEAELHDLDPS